MKRLVLAASAVMLLSAAPAMAMNMKGKKGGCCCDKMGGRMSHRA